jgi:hypothetical protein
MFDLLDQPENAWGWRLRLIVDRHGVVSSSIDSIHIDDEGTPFPVPPSPRPAPLKEK